jgi:hypothetical protein
MSDEEEAIGNEVDRALRAAVMGASQVAETLQRRHAERNRQRTEQMTQQTREQQETTRLVLDRMQRESFWRSADGERVATAATYAATLSEVDPRAKEAYQVIRERTQQLYGIDLDRLRADFPDSEDKRRDTLLHAVDDFLDSKRSEREAKEDRSLGTDLTATADEEREAADKDRAERGDDSTAREEESDIDGAFTVGADEDFGEPLDDPLDEELLPPDNRSEDLRDGNADLLEESAQDAFSDAHGHELDRDKAREHGLADEAYADRLEHPVDAGRETPQTPAGQARVTAGQSFPESAAAVLAGSRGKRQPRSRAGRRSQTSNEYAETLTK